MYKYFNLNLINNKKQGIFALLFAYINIIFSVLGLV